MIALIALVTIVMIGTILALVLTGCASSSYGGGPSGSGSGVKQGTSNSNFTEHKITLSDGRTVTCLTWETYNYMTESAQSGMDCLEPRGE
jgi:hypothetical protein